MKNLLSVTLIICGTFFQISAFAQVDNTQAIMRELGTHLDVAETSLRIILGPERSFGMYSNKAKIHAAVYLLNFEQRHPGYLRGLHGEADWAQYKEVRRLFSQLEQKSDFWYKDGQVDGSAAVMSRVATEMDIAESNLRLVLNKPAENSMTAKVMFAFSDKLAAALRLLNFEQRHPGVMGMQQAQDAWAQHQEVINLHKMLMMVYDL